MSNQTDIKLISQISQFVANQPNKVLAVPDFKLAKDLLGGYLNEWGLVTTDGQYYLYEYMSEDELRRLLVEVFKSGFNVLFNISGGILAKITPTNGEDPQTFLSKLKDYTYFLSVFSSDIICFNFETMEKVGFCEIDGIGSDIDYSDFELK